MITLFNTTIRITNLDENAYTKLIDFLEDSYTTYEEIDFEEFTIDERTETEKYQDWLLEQADNQYENEKLGLK